MCVFKFPVRENDLPQDSHLCIGTFDLYGLLLCVSEGVLSELLCVYIVDMGTFDFDALTLCESEGLLSNLL